MRHNPTSDGTLNVKSCSCNNRFLGYLIGVCGQPSSWDLLTKSETTASEKVFALGDLIQESQKSYRVPGFTGFPKKIGGVALDLGLNVGAIFDRLRESVRPSCGSGSEFTLH